MLEAMLREGMAATRFTVSRMLMKTAGDSRCTKNMTAVYRAIGLAERFIQQCPEEADEVLFNALLDTCYRARDLCRLEHVVKRMQELQVYPSHVTLGILVKAYGQAGDSTQVLRLWDEMKEQREQANAVTFGCMIDACAKCGFMQKAVEIFQSMKRRRKHRNTILYTTLIKGYGMEKDLRSALALFREMKDERVPYNRITYNSTIDVCIKCSDVQAAENILAEMTSTSSNLEPDLITYSTLLKGYCHIGDLDKALQIADTIKSKGLRCDELVYNTLMDGCVRANDLSAGIGLFAEMTHSGMAPSTITHSILVRLYQRSGYTEQALEAVAQLYEHHGIPRPSPNAPLTSASTSEQTSGSYNTGAKSGKGGRLYGRRAGRGRTQRAAPGPPLYAPPGFAGVAANMDLSPATYLSGAGVTPQGFLQNLTPQGFLQNLQQPPLLPNLLPAVPGSVLPPPPPHLALGGAELGTAPLPGMAAAPVPLPPGNLLGHPCNLSQQPPGVLLGPDSLLFPYKHVESDAAWSTLANSYACGHLPYMLHEAAKPPVSTDVQQGFANAGSQIWGGA
jgi:pentatricopeptide repeat protein